MQNRLKNLFKNIGRNNVNRLIQAGGYEEALTLLIAEFQKIRMTDNKSAIAKIQANFGKQAEVLMKLGRYQEALHKYELQADICSNMKMFEPYAACLLNLAKLIFEHIDNDDRAIMILKEAVIVAQNNNQPEIEREAITMLNRLE